jgi:CheY-like chemotaxis protein/two-component sensor histidine kinase
LTAATTQAIHWIGNKALPITTSVARIQADLAGGQIDADSLREDLELIGESARLIVRVKEQLLGPAREQKPRPALLADVVQAAAFHTGVPAGRLALHVAPHTPLALADTTQLARALGNLLQNALEAGASQITVRIAPAAEAGYVSVGIADDGAGIPAELLDRMWAAFVTTKGGDHAGLGLPACLAVIAQLDGRIAVASQVGRGTTFTILLPASPDAPAADLRSAPGSVLLIDDDDDWARWATNALAAAGKSVTRQIAADKVAQADLILVDEALEAASLADTLAALQVAGAAGKTIVVSAAVKVERTTSYLQAGAKDAVLKPYTPGELAALLA